MKPSFAVILGLFVVWIIVALALDRWVLSPLCASCAQFATMAFVINAPGIEGELPAISITILFGIPLIIHTVYLIPWKRIRDKLAWRKALSSWSRPVVWSLLSFGCIVAGEFFYLIFQGLIPSFMDRLAKSFSFSISVIIGGHKFLKVTGSPTSFLGMLLGIFLFVRYGITPVYGDETA